MRFDHKYIAEIGDSREIADHPGETGLGCPISRRFCEKWGLLSGNIINPEAQGMFDRPRHDLARNAFRPVSVRQESVDYVQIEPRRISADEIFTAPMLDNAGFHFDILNGQRSIQHSAVTIQPAQRLIAQFG